MIDAVQGGASSRFSCGSCALCSGGYWSVYFMSPPLVFVVRPVNECLPGLDKITDCLIRGSRGS